MSLSIASPICISCQVYAMSAKKDSKLSNEIRKKEEQMLPRLTLTWFVCMWMPLFAFALNSFLNISSPNTNRQRTAIDHAYLCASCVSWNRNSMHINEIMRQQYKNSANDFVSCSWFRFIYKYPYFMCCPIVILSQF